MLVKSKVNSKEGIFLIHLIFIFITIILYEPHGALASPLTLSSTVPAGEHVCPGQELMFTCSTEDSPTIAFASVDYIDVGSQLEFAAFNMPGDTRTSPINPDTIATLVENRINENGKLILISELRLIVLPQFPIFSITCVHGNGTGITTTISVQEPIVPQNVTVKQKVEMYTGNCTVYIAWITPINTAQEDVSHYIIYINGTSYVYILNKTATTDQNNLILTTFPVCTCAEHQVSVSAVDRCDREGQRSPSIIPDQDRFADTENVVCEFAPSTNPGSTATEGSADTIPTHYYYIIIAVTSVIIFASIQIVIIVFRCIASRNKNYYNSLSTSN